MSSHGTCTVDTLSYIYIAREFGVGLESTYKHFITLFYNWALITIKKFIHKARLITSYKTHN